MLKCLSARIKHYKKDEFIIRSGDYIRSVGMVLTGTALIIQEDFWGKRTIISEAMSGALFAETYACIPSIPIEMSVISDSECDVLFMDINRIMNVCTSACTFHTRLLQNFFIFHCQAEFNPHEKNAAYVQKDHQGKTALLPFRRILKKQFLHF